jgi:hypothetical protein
MPPGKVGRGLRCFAGAKALLLVPSVLRRRWGAAALL